MRGIPRNYVGERFGRLIVNAQHRAGRRTVVECSCDCGSSLTARVDGMVSGRVVSCGCQRKDSTRTHGMTGTQIHRTWITIVHRCHSPGSKDYPRYGGRGIRVCDRWRDSFEAFLADMGERPSQRHSIDRIGNDRGYEPGNCRWATVGQQARNKRGVKLNEVSVSIMRHLHRRGCKVADIADAFEVNRDTANDAILGKTWVTP